MLAKPNKAANGQNGKRGEESALRQVLKAGGACLVLGMLTAGPAQAVPEVEFDLPDGQQVSAIQMAKALMDALETADPVQRPLLLQALARVLELPPEALIADATKDKPAPVY